MIGGSRHALKTLTGRGATAAAAALQNEAFHRKMAACSDTLQEQKKALRKVLKAKLRQMSAEDMQAESETSQVFAATCPLMVVRGIFRMYSLYNSGPEHLERRIVPL